MIPDELIGKAERAIYQATGQHLGRTWEETPQWYRVGVAEEARGALEAVAADIWDQGCEAGLDWEASWTTYHVSGGDQPDDIANPYRASETA